MKTGRLGVSVLAILLVSACGSREPQDVPEDQLNHFAGIAEHDHPLPPAANQQRSDKVTIVEPTDAEQQPAR